MILDQFMKYSFAKILTLNFMFTLLSFGMQDPSGSRELGFFGVITGLQIIRNIIAPSQSPHQERLDATIAGTATEPNITQPIPGEETGEPVGQPMETQIERIMTAPNPQPESPSSGDDSSHEEVEGSCDDTDNPPTIDFSDIV